VANNEARYREAEQRLWDSVGVTPIERRVHLGRTGVSVRVLEVGEGPTVVFVHGATNGGSSWASLAARLDGFRCVLLDRPGCGLSDPLPARFEDIDELDAFADRMIVELLDELGLETAHVVATSFGGYFTLRAAAASPDRFGRIVEMGWSFGAPILHVPLLMRLGSVPLFARLATRMPLNERAVRAMLRQIGLRGALKSGRFDQHSVDWYLALLRDTGTMRNELAVAPRIILPIRGLNERVLLQPSLLAAIRTPIQFLWGEDDPFGGAETARRFVEQLPSAQLELMPGVGHAPWMDDPDHAATVVRRFLDE